MNPFASEQTVKLTVGEDLYIEVKEALSYADSRAIQKAVIEGLYEGGNPQNGLRPDWQPDTDDITMMLRTIKAWNFTNGNKEVAPITEETFFTLKKVVWDAIVAALNTQYAPPSGEEKKV